MDFKLSPEEVISTLTEVRDKIVKLNELSQKLKEDCEAYRNNFQDEIAEKSTEIIAQIDENLTELKTAFDTMLVGLTANMEMISEWREYK
jgi:hypothetical protein